MIWLRANWPSVLDLAWAHLLLALPAIALSVLIAVPIGLFAQRKPRAGGPLLVVASLLYTIPALPLLIVVPIVIGTPLRSSATMIVALTVYGTALLVRSAADAFASVDPAVRQAARAVGMTRGRMFWQVDLPLSLPVLVPGIRVMTVSTVSLVTIGALIGVHGLGSLLTDGFQRGIMASVLTGVVGTVVLAVLLDLAWILVGRLATPWLHVGGRAGGGARGAPGADGAPSADGTAERPALDNVPEIDAKTGAVESPGDREGARP